MFRVYKTGAVPGLSPLSTGSDTVFTDEAGLVVNPRTGLVTGQALYTADCERIIGAVKPGERIMVRNTISDPDRLEIQRLYEVVRVGTMSRGEFMATVGRYAAARARYDAQRQSLNDGYNQRIAALQAEIDRLSTERKAELSRAKEPSIDDFLGE